MESAVTQECKKSFTESQHDITESVDNFQKLMYELFEKNGILNDLRAYLRGHIINVLRSTQTGNLPSCQKHYIQRLELCFQALNILIAEYLLRLEFGYSLSVFVSEIPLANMVFDFAKCLMQRNSDDEIFDIRFTENDVWSILNYLGVPCDSEYASSVIKMYKEDNKTSLLMCILKCQSMYGKSTADLGRATSEETLTSGSIISENEVELNRQHKSQPHPEKCKHLKFCKTCQNRMSDMKDTYKKKKKYLFKNVKSSVTQLNMKHFVENVGVWERTLVDELFHQLKSVYESEVEMMKIEEEKKIKRSMASHALQLQRERDELEQSFKVREEELERNVAEKKKFLWGLARALRDQHRHMSRAMHDVRMETDRLTAKEESLKTQMAEAEATLQNRGEEMHLQISNELSILEGHLSSMRKERECINKERTELETIKEQKTNKNNKTPSTDTEVSSQYDHLRNELDVLKKHLLSSKFSPKTVERGTVTDISDVISKLNVGLNNNQSADRSRHDDFDDRLKNQLVNDFKKKNVNFTPSHLDEIYRDPSHTRSHSSESSETGDTPQPSNVTCHLDSDSNFLQELREENIRLKECSRYQQAQIEALSRAASLLPCACAARAGPMPSPRARPRTAPPTRVAPAASTAVATPTTIEPFQFIPNMNTSVSANTVSIGWRKGAGEEMCMFRNAQSRVLVPGDTIPFVGVLRDRHNPNKRQLLSQLRAFRSRTYPLIGISKRNFSTVKERHGSSSPTVIVSNPRPSCSLQSDNVKPTKSVREKCHHRQAKSDTNRNREKSPKSVLKEAKAKLRNIKESSIVTHEKSPNSVLREAKLRLRKLEIEAEAMEKSYFDFRRRQSGLKIERSDRLMIKDDPVSMQFGSLDINRSHSLYKIDNMSTNRMEAPLTDYEKSMRIDFDKYLREYQNTIDLKDTHFKNQTVADILKPIPLVYKEVNENPAVESTNYLETPLTEFRKFYHSNRKITEDNNEKVRLKNVPSKLNTLSIQGTIERGPESTEFDAAQTQHTITSELSILKQDINTMCNTANNIELKLNEEIHHTASEQKEENLQNERDGQNLLKIEIINGTEKTENLSVVVESTVLDIPVSVDQKDYSPNHIKNQQTVILAPETITPRSGKAKDISPKRNKRSLSPEHQANLTRNDVLDAIFNIDTDKENPNTAIDSELPKDVSEAKSDHSKAEDYDDNLSADIDHYDSHTELPNSPISLVKTDEDENFWD